MRAFVLITLCGSSFEDVRPFPSDETFCCYDRSPLRPLYAAILASNVGTIFGGPQYPASEARGEPQPRGDQRQLSRRAYESVLHR